MLGICVPQTKPANSCDAPLLRRRADISRTVLGKDRDQIRKEAGLVRQCVWNDCGRCLIIKGLREGDPISRETEPALLTHLINSYLLRLAGMVNEAM